MQPGRFLIGVDGRPFQDNLTGIGRYAFELSMQLDRRFPEARFLVYCQFPPRVRFPSDRWIVRCDRSPFSRIFKRILWLKMRCGILCRKDPLDAFFGCGTFLPLLPEALPKVSVVFDLNHLLFPETMHAPTMIAYRLFFSRDVRHATRIISISHGTARKLEQLYGRKTAQVIHPGVGSCFQIPSENERRRVREKYSLSQPFMLALGTLEPRKNLQALLEAFRRLKADGANSGLSLVVVGGKGWKTSGLLSTLEKLEGVVWLGFVPDEDLAGLYSSARLFVFPSIYEGFGIPVIEARACGTPVLTSDIEELREAGGEDAEYVKPTVEGILQGLRHCLSSDRQPLPHSDSSLPTWTRGGELLADVFGGILPPRPQSTFRRNYNRKE